MTDESKIPINENPKVETSIQVDTLSSTNEQIQEKIPIPTRKKRTIKGNQILVVSVVAIILFSAFSIAVFEFEEGKIKTMKTSYIQLEENYTSLQSQHNTLTSEYSSLSSEYSSLSSQYYDLNSKYTQLTQLTSQLPITHLMALMDTQIRESCQPNYSPWLGQYVYDQASVEYAATVCAHDLGRRYWPSVEANYYNIAGRQLCDDAHTRITNLVNSLGITSYMTTNEKIEKILDFTSTKITYEKDLNDEFLFPTETITFRSGDCDDFSILAATLFEEVGIDSAIGFFENTSTNSYHCMVLVHLSDLGSYGSWGYSDLTNMGLSSGKWTTIEPQRAIINQNDATWFQQWSLIVASEIPNA